MLGNSLIQTPLKLNSSDIEIQTLVIHELTTPIQDNIKSSVDIGTEPLHNPPPLPDESQKILTDNLEALESAQHPETKKQVSKQYNTVVVTAPIMEVK